MNSILNEPVNEAGEFFPILNLKRMLFIQYIGHRAYEETRRASLPQNPAQKSINFMVGVVRQAFEPQGLVEANRMRFATLVQRDGQSAQRFVNALQVAVDACDFGTAYSMTLKSRLLAGIRDDRIGETLLSQSLNQDYEATKTRFFAIGRQPSSIRSTCESSQRASSSAPTRTTWSWKSTRTTPFVTFQLNLNSRTSRCKPSWSCPSRWNCDNRSRMLAMRPCT